MPDHIALSPVVGHGGAQDAGRATTPDPSTLELSNDAWKSVLVDQEITADTVLTFEFRSDGEGEIHGIGFDTDARLSPEWFFQLDGTQSYGRQDVNALYTTGSGFQAYEIRVGSFFTGSFDRLVFAMDNDNGFGADSVFRNIRFDEVPAPRPAVEIDGFALDVVSHGGAQDAGRATTPDPSTLELSNDAWKSVLVDQEITADTVLTFEFRSDGEGEIHGIGFDTDARLSPEWFFQLDGTQSYGRQDVNALYTTGSGFQAYEIRVGSFFTGSFDRLVFAMDNDKGFGADSVFRNIRFDEVPAPRPAVEIDGFALDVVSHGGAQDAGRATTPDPSTLELSNDAWKSVLVDQEITADTVLTFEFRSDGEGEIHGIGFDTDARLSPEWFFQLDGTQSYGRQDVNALYTTGSGFQAYEIRVGSFFTGSFDRLVFAMDNDNGFGADSVFRNIRFDEVPAPRPAVEIDGFALDVVSHGGAQDAGRATTPDPSTLELSNDAWKSVLVDQEITADTVLTFEFRSDGEGEIHGIGFDTDARLSPEWFFQLDGTQSYGRQDVNALYTTGSGFQAYEIRVGSFFTGSFDRLVFAMDNDKGFGADSVFRNISLNGAILPVNDAPGFVAGADQSILEDAGPQTIAGWATDISAGPADEAGQAVTFAVTTDNDALFAVGPTVSGDGTLRYELAADANGAATVTVVATDDGGTANGGIDTSAPQTFTIEAAPVNDAPVIDTIAQAELTESFLLSTVEGSISVTFTDVDLPDIGHGATVVSTGATGATAGLTLDAAGLAALITPGAVSKAAGSTDGALTLSFAAGPEAFRYLRADETVTLSYQVAVDDGDGGVGLEDFDVVVTGTDAAIELSEVERDSDERGFVINGVSADDLSGFSVSSAGDVNGDGLDDLIVGARTDDPNGSASGASFVVFGKADGTAVELSAVEAGTGGFVINGVSAFDESGRSVSSAGDVNGDGLDDLIVGAYLDDPNGSASGASFVVFGKADGTAVELSAVEAGTGGFVINGVSAGDISGYSVSSAGDVNGDGLDDLIVGASFDDPNGSASGASFVVFGKGDGAAVELSAVEAGTGGFVINGVSADDLSGRSVSSAGDVNGDGLDDLIVGASRDDPNGDRSGASFVVFGKADGTAVELSAVEAGTGGFVINGVSAVNYAGRSVSSAGDVNGDGLDDLIVGAYRDDPNGSSSGASFVVFGKADGAAVELSSVEAGTGGFVINGVSAGDFSGRSVSSAGDVNGDGLDDLIVGAPNDDPNDVRSGASFVVFGKADGAAVELSAVEAGTGGFVINGVSAGDRSGVSVSSAGDVNGDGFDDLIVGALSDDPNGFSSGASFVVFGGNFSGAATQVGTTGADDLTGTAAADVLIGGTGDDTLAGNGGADVLRGGAGDDLIAVGDLTFAKVDGGNGVDTLRLDGAGLELDLTTIAGPRLQEIERIDLGGGGNALRLDRLETLGISGETNTLRVLGTAADAVTLIEFGWSAQGTLTDAEGTFDILTNGLARLEVQQDLDLVEPILIELSEVERDSDERGFVINGVSADDRSGFSVSSAGDVNGDGLDDLIVGAYRDDPNGDRSGASFVVFGKGDGAAVELSAVEAGTGGFVINGVSAGDISGRSVSSAGDVNGDGLDDLIVGASFDDPNGSASGASFVVFGKADGAAVELSAVEAGTGGFVINGVSAGDYAGRSVSSAGDVNGDGLDDLIVGANLDDPNGSNSGASFVVFGKADGMAVELSSVEAGTGGFVINGVSAGDFSGRSVSSAGDVNGDGLDDLIVGADGDDPNGSGSGASFVVFGKADGTAVELSSVEAGTGGFVINGVSAGDYSGGSVSSAGDVNGDGFDDLIVGASRDDPNGINSGASFVVFGKTDGVAVELSSVEAGTGGFVINGVSADDRSGGSVSSAGDVNGDGLDDLIVGADRDDPNGDRSGASFVVFGKADGAAVELSAVEASTGGFVINGVSADDRSGRSVSSAGDVNGDGFDDLIVGAPDDDPNGSASGASFVVFGGNFSGAATQVGTTGADDLTGTAAADVLIGGTGDDTLAGDGGADVLRGGAGDDLIAVGDLTFAKVDGGNGVDTLRLDGAGLELDLTAIAGPRLQEIERIDLGGGGNALRLDRLEVLGISGDTNTLRVLGTAADAVTLIESGWSAQGTLTDAEGTFDILTNGLARLEVQQGLDLVEPILIELSEVERDSDERGFVINGVSADDRSGFSVSSAGDVNGDGLDDLIVGASFDDPNGSASGASFVVFGKADGAAVELSAVEAGTGGFVINGVSAGDYAGRSVSSAGDVNGDGLDDLIVGANLDDPNGSNSGASFVVFGKTDGVAVELSAVEAGTGGFVINGVSADDLSGRSVSSAGDVNGDGLDDLIVGAYLDDPNGTSSGASFVVFGKADGAAVELSAVEAGTGGFVINGVSAFDNSGRSVSSAGDVNGDGLDDLIVGAFRDDPNGSNSGASFVVFGKGDGAAVELSSVEAGTGGFVINGVSTFDFSGYSVSSAGDVNGDGLDDLIVGAYLDDPNGSASGASFVVFGKADGAAVELSAVEAGTGGFVINGVSASDTSGRSVSSAGDVNGDGLDDLIVGANLDDPNGFSSGVSFVVFGKADGAAVELSAVEAGTGGFVINGVSANDRSGGSVSSAGDVNGDGFDDLIVGAPADDPNGSNSGASFVVFGGNFSGAATQVGTTGADDLTGTAAVDVIFAGTGDDTITGNGGADRLSGGQGNDTFVFTDAGGTATVIDFEDGLGGQDVLDVSAFGFANGAEVLALAGVSGPGGHDVLIQLDVDDAILLKDFEFADLDATDFLI